MVPVAATGTSSPTRRAEAVTLETSDAVPIPEPRPPEEIDCKRPVERRPSHRNAAASRQAAILAVRSSPRVVTRTFAVGSVTTFAGSGLRSGFLATSSSFSCAGRIENGSMTGSIPPDIHNKVVSGLLRSRWQKYSIGSMPGSGIDARRSSGFSAGVLTESVEIGIRRAPPAFGVANCGW
jgi:hypothetical protein